jgi:hypothetical protein
LSSDEPRTARKSVFFWHLILLTSIFGQKVDASASSVAVPRTVLLRHGQGYGCRTRDEGGNHGEA